MDQGASGSGTTHRAATGGVLLGFEFTATSLRAVAAAAPGAVAGDRPRALGAGGDWHRRVGGVYLRAGADSQLFAAGPGVCKLADAAADRAGARIAGRGGHAAIAACDRVALQQR